VGAPALRLRPGNHLIYGIDLRDALFLAGAGRINRRRRTRARKIHCARAGPGLRGHSLAWRILYYWKAKDPSRGGQHRKLLQVYGWARMGHLILRIPAFFWS